MGESWCYVIRAAGTALPTVGRLFLNFIPADATKFEYANETCDRCNDVTVCASWSTVLLRTVKNLVNKTMEDGSDVLRALLNFRNTVREG